MKTKCPACDVSVEVAMVEGEMLQLDTEMIDQGEMPDGVGYQMHNDGTATNWRRKVDEARSEGKAVPKIGRHRIEHRHMCPAMVTMSQGHTYPARLRKIVEQRAKDHATGLVEARSPAV